MEIPYKIWQNQTVTMYIFSMIVRTHFVVTDKYVKKSWLRIGSSRLNGPKNHLSSPSTDHKLNYQKSLIA